MELKIIAEVTKIIGEKSGTRKNGKDWTLAEIALKYGEGSSEKTFHGKAMGEIAKTLKHFKVGAIVSVLVEPETREWNGKYYTDVMIKKIETLEAGGDEEPSIDQPDIDTELGF